MHVAFVWSLQALKNFPYIAEHSAMSGGEYSVDKPRREQ